MKYRHQKKFYRIELQLFAGEGAPGEGSQGTDGEPGGEQEEADNGGEEDEEERRFSQKDVDDAVKKQLAREKRKWQREQEKKAQSGSKGKESSDDDEASETDRRLKEAEARAERAETRAACFDAGVDKDAIDDVTALAHAYMAADEALDLEDAIEKVVKKYPQFKKKTSDGEEDAEAAKGKAWGERHKGAAKKMTGVEAAFLAKNPGLKY